MTDRWFYAHAGHKLGPFSGRQLHDLSSAGEILRTDTVWKEGVESGVLARRVRNLFSEPAPATVLQVASRPQDPPVSAPGGQPPSARPVDTAAPATEFKPVPGKSIEETGSAATPPTDVQPIPAKIELAPEGQTPSVPARPPLSCKPARKGRAVAVKGAVIISQDGTCAKYKQKCSVCSHENMRT